MLLVVDAVEGVMVGTERAIKAAAAEGLPICLLISKVDRQAPRAALPPRCAVAAAHRLRGRRRAAGSRSPAPCWRDEAEFLPCR